MKNTPESQYYNIGFASNLAYKGRVYIYARLLNGKTSLVVVCKTNTWERERGEAADSSRVGERRELFIVKAHGRSDNVCISRWI